MDFSGIIYVCPKLLYTILVCLFSLMIYGDAVRNKIGYVRGSNSWINSYAGSWAFCSLFAVIYPLILIPILYVIFRKRLINRAKQHPVHVTTSQRIVTTIILVSAAIFFISGAETVCRGYEINKSLEEHYLKSKAAE